MAPVELDFSLEGKLGGSEGRRTSMSLECFQPKNITLFGGGSDTRKGLPHIPSGPGPRVTVSFRRGGQTSPEKPNASVTRVV